MSANCGDYGGGGLEYVMNFPSLSCLTSFADAHLLHEESVRRVWRGQMCFWMGSHSENTLVVLSFFFNSFYGCKFGWKNNGAFTRCQGFYC